MAAPRRTPFHWFFLGDAILIGADVLQRNGVLSDVRFLVTHEAGFGEIFQYVKAALAVVMLATLAIRRRSVSALMWAILLTIVLLDDSLSIHERAGVHLAAVAGLPHAGALRANQVGELICFAGLGLLCAIAVAVGWYRGDPEDRRFSRTLLVWFGALGFCAVVLDAVASLARGSAVAGAFGVLEDGGEMIVLTFLLIAVWRGLRPAVVFGSPGTP